VSEFLNCPFCGEQPQVTERAGSSSESHPYLCFVTCTCGGYSARAHQYGGGRERAQARRLAIAAWNRRAPSPDRGTEAGR